MKIVNEKPLVGISVRLLVSIRRRQNVLSFTKSQKMLSRMRYKILGQLTKISSTLNRLVVSLIELWGLKSPLFSGKKSQVEQRSQLVEYNLWLCDLSWTARKKSKHSYQPNHGKSVFNLIKNSLQNLQK